MDKQYSIDVKGIHCSGCVNLIKLVLEEFELSEINVNEALGEVTFKSSKTESEVNDMLTKAFQEDLNNYSYSNLHIIN